MQVSPFTRMMAIIVLILLPAPLVVVIGASFSPDIVMRFPPDGLSLRWYRAILDDPRWLSTFGTSVAIAALSAGLTTFLSLLAAVALDGAPAKVRSFCETAILAPLLFPHAAIGIAFIYWLQIFWLNGTFIGVLIAHLILCVPFAYRPVAVSLRQLDRSTLEAASMLGASPVQMFFRVILPLMRPGIATALLFSFIISFDEVTVSMFLVGPFLTTLPVSIYSYLHDSSDPVVAAISSLLIVLTAVLVLLLDRFAGLQFFVSSNEDHK